MNRREGSDGPAAAQSAISDREDARGAGDGSHLSTLSASASTAEQPHDQQGQRPEQGRQQSAQESGRAAPSAASGSQTVQGQRSNTTSYPSQASPTARGSDEWLASSFRQADEPMAAVSRPRLAIAPAHGRDVSDSAAPTSRHDFGDPDSSRYGRGRRYSDASSGSGVPADLSRLLLPSNQEPQADLDASSLESVQNLPPRLPRPPRRPGYSSSSATFVSAQTPFSSDGQSAIGSGERSSGSTLPNESTSNTSRSRIGSSRDLSSKAADVEAFLGRVNLHEYFDTFMQNGFDRLGSLIDATEADFDMLKVKRGHRRVIQREVASLQGLPLSHSISDGQAKVSSEEAEAPDSSDSRSAMRPSSGQITQQNSAVFVFKGQGKFQGKSGSRSAEKDPRPRRKYRRHPKPDPNALEKPTSAYVQFASAVREEVKGKTFAELAKIVGERWKALPPNEKEARETEAARQKDDWSHRMAEYRESPEYRSYQAYLREFRAQEQARLASRAQHNSDSREISPEMNNNAQWDRDNTGQDYSDPEDSYPESGGPPSKRSRPSGRSFGQGQAQMPGPLLSPMPFWESPGTSSVMSTQARGYQQPSYFSGMQDTREPRGRSIAEALTRPTFTSDQASLEAANQYPWMDPRQPFAQRPLMPMHHAERARMEGNYGANFMLDGPAPKQSLQAPLRLPAPGNTGAFGQSLPTPSSSSSSSSRFPPTSTTQTQTQTHTMYGQPRMHMSDARSAQMTPESYLPQNDESDLMQ
ncbi:uncharacterized protein L969DRAFT_96921 [Mixia osmundae IAM 14324]|uniref:HMG box domain-containing protein n=1 Tax=Mixia osmundae (strain CBS 9802 / IAM 14324 / JCM 22182 / KY 12970) TaxID=764103 RepID=G7E2H4_MIXOS|nr:uncharacterized protein L969DRAFT_96921 [Mixia osmundae IAM 14324]KEI36905.1 hypothetical protein L969DRAFT_96921 [Mixia osmundae IAM 14324]GAA97034.1 hypothetical protein E5Q_03709 [Mixia osmundae IAM 14324]